MSEITQNPSSIILTTTKPTVAKKPTTKRGGGRSGGKFKSATAAAAKQQPLKVVYISNPMRIETSAAEFRALVQELTGRDAADWTCPDQIPRVAAENISNDIHVLPHDAGGDHLTMSGFGSDLGCFGPFDGAHDDQMVDLELEDFESFYGYGCLHQ